jgi:DNA-binding IclR family transcriptional regulator
MTGGPAWIGVPGAGAGLHPAIPGCLTSELEALRDQTKETVHLVVLDQMQIVYLEKIPGLHAIGLMSSRVGLRTPAYCTGVGKALLAYQKEDQIREYYRQNGLERFTDTTITDLAQLMSHLAQIRCQGYALDRGEHEDEVRCVAAPVFDLSAKVVAAVSISGPALRMDPIENNLELIELADHCSQNILAAIHPRKILIILRRLPCVAPKNRIPRCCRVSKICSKSTAHPVLLQMPRSELG